MNRSLDYYLGLIGKHWIQVLLIAALTGVGGYLYLTRQVPVFRATVKLRIIRQQSRASRDVSFTFEEDQVFYNTQYDLLRTQIDWADMLLDRVAYRVVTRLGDGDADAALENGTGMTSEQIVARLGGAAEADEFKVIEPPSWEEPLDDAGNADLLAQVSRIRTEVIQGRLGLTADSFLAGITARPIPGTHLAELSYEAKDPGVAVLLVNMYAELYRDRSRGERRRSIQEEIQYREKKQDTLQADRDTARTSLDSAISGFRKNERFGHLNPGGGMNPFQEQAEAVDGILNEKELEQIVRQEEEGRLRDVLKEQGFAVQREQNGEGRRFLRRTTGGEGGEGSLHTDLAGNMTILAQPMVRTSANVQDFRARLQERIDDRARQLERFTPTSEEVREAERHIETARAELGAEIEATVLRYFRAGEDLAEVIEKLGARLREKQEDARDLNAAHQTVAEQHESVDALDREISTLEQERLALMELSDRALNSGGPLAIQNIRIERRARLRDAPQIRPNSTLIILFAVFAAFVLSLGSVFLVEFFDDTIKTKEDFDRLVTVPDLGFIPRIGDKEFERRDAAVLEKPRSSVAEAFRSLRTGILFSRRDEEIQCFLVSSAGPGEGKTTITTNLAIIMAEAGRGKVLVIDADLRKARLHTALGVDNGPGLTNCLVGSSTLAEVVRPTPVENLYVLTSGPTPPNPAELLGGHRMAEILEEARAEYGKVIIDTPPLVAVTDTALLAPLVQGVFLVVSMGKTSWRLIDRAKQSLAAVGREITGGIVNEVRSTHRGYGYGYGYTYDRSYGQPEDGEE